MVDVTEALTRRIADLARLELTDREAAAFATQLHSVLAHFELLQQADVREVDPLYHPFDAPTPLRPDEARPFARDAEGRPAILAAAPELLHDGFKVPQVL